MQSTAYALSPSTPLLNLRTPSRYRLANPNPKSPISASFSSSSPPSSLSLSSSPFKSKPISIHGISCSPRTQPSDREVAVRSVVGESSGEITAEKSGGGLLQTLQLGALFGLWYFFNIYNKQGKILKNHPPIKFFVSVSGSKFRDPIICDIAYKDPIKVKFVHFIGDKDWLKLPSEDLAAAFESPLIIRHPQGHTVTRLDETAVQQLSEWTSSIIECSVVPITTNGGEKAETEVVIPKAAA